MGGKVAVVVRYKDKQCVAFKVHTSFLKNTLNTPKALDENWLKKCIVDHDLLHDNEDGEIMSQEYESDKAVLAPYYYGIILFDYYNNTIATANNYNAIITASTFNVHTQYRRALNSDFEARLQEGNNITIFNLKECVFFEEYASHFLDHALRHNAIIKHNNIAVKHNGTIESVVGALYKLPLENKSKEEQVKILKDYDNNLIKFDDDGNYQTNWDSFNDVTFEYPEFNIINAGSAEDSQIVLDYMLQNSFELSNYEKEIWQRFIKENKKDKVID